MYKNYNPHKFLCFIYFMRLLLQIFDEKTGLKIKYKQHVCLSIILYSNSVINTNYLFLLYWILKFLRDELVCGIPWGANQLFSSKSVESKFLHVSNWKQEIQLEFLPHLVKKYYSQSSKSYRYSNDLFDIDLLKNFLNQNLNLVLKVFSMAHSALKLEK